MILSNLEIALKNLIKSLVYTGELSILDLIIILMGISLV